MSAWRYDAVSPLPGPVPMTGRETPLDPGKSTGPVLVLVPTILEGDPPDDDAEAKAVALPVVGPCAPGPPGPASGRPETGRVPRAVPLDA